MAGDGDVGDVQLALLGRKAVVHDRGPVDVQPEVCGRDEEKPGERSREKPAADARRSPRIDRGELLQAHADRKPHWTERRRSMRRIPMFRTRPMTPISSMAATTRSYRLPALRESMTRYPRPESTAIISAATTTSHAMPSAMRSPVRT